MQLSVFCMAGGYALPKLQTQLADVSQESSHKSTAIQAVDSNECITKSLRLSRI